LACGWSSIPARAGTDHCDPVRDGEGIEAGKTKIRYKEVDIGDVKAISLSDDRKSAVISAQVIKSARDLLVEDSKFFVVRPRISGGTVSGLGTLLSGV